MAAEERRHRHLNSRAAGHRDVQRAFYGRVRRVEVAAGWAVRPNPNGWGEVTRERLGGDLLKVEPHTKGRLTSLGEAFRRGNELLLSRAQFVTSCCALRFHRHARASQSAQRASDRHADVNSRGSVACCGPLDLRAQAEVRSAQSPQHRRKFSNGSC